MTHLLGAILAVVLILPATGTFTRERACVAGHVTVNGVHHRPTHRVCLVPLGETSGNRGTVTVRP